MKTIFILLFSFSFIVLNTQNCVQTDTIKTDNVIFKDFTVVENEIYAISYNDNLIHWNINSGLKKLLKEDVNTLAKGKNNKLYIAKTNGELWSFELNKKWEYISDIKTKAYQIIVDKEDNPLVLYEKGVLRNNTIIKPQPSRFYSGKRNGDSIIYSLKKPTLTYLDKRNRVWLSYDNGEFGEDLWFFDLNNNTFYEEEYLSIETEYRSFENRSRYEADLIKAFPDKIKIVNNDTLYKFPAQIPIYNGIKGISENSKNHIYISQSLNHFGVESSFFKIKESDFLDFYKTFSLNKLVGNIEKEVTINFGEGDKRKTTISENEYFGPLTYNEYDDSVYLYSSQGFFKIIDSEEKVTKSLIINPNLTWKSGLTNSIGSQMTVKKFMFIDKIKFLFLTNVNGIGYYDGKQITYFK